MPARKDEVGGLTTYRRRHGIKGCKPANMVFYGDSHVGGLVKWLGRPGVRGGPSKLEIDVFKGSQFIYSGGSKWTNVHKRVQGIDVPVHQTHGNLWGKVIQEIREERYFPEYIYVSCIGNDLDNLNDKLYTNMVLCISIA